jgi:hypothetical protein
LKNLKVDDSVFCGQANKNVENTQDNNKKNSNKQKKSKKGQDFMEYAKNNGIDLKIQYDEGDKNEKNYDKKNNTNYQGNKGTYQNNKNFQGKRFYQQGNQTNNVEGNTTNQVNNNTQENNYNRPRKNFGSYQNNYNKKGFNQQNNKNFHTVNKFDSFNAPQFQGAPGNYFPYPQQGNHMSNNMNNMVTPNHFQQNQVNTNQEPVDVDNFILNSLEFYFSEKNLNNNYYMRVKLDPEGYLNVNDLVTFNKVRQNGVTVEKIKETLEKHQLSENIEVRNGGEGELLFRNKNWDLIRDNLTPIEVLQQRKNFKKFNNHQNYNPNFKNLNYVGMQNNYYYQMNPLQFDPNMLNQQMMPNYGIGMNPGYLQYSQFQGYDMKMMNYNMYPGNMGGNQISENTENLNN